MTEKENQKLIEENARHIAIINDEMGKVQKAVEGVCKEVNDINITIAKLSIDVDWIKKFFWIAMAAGIGGFVTGLLNLLMKGK